MKTAKQTRRICILVLGMHRSGTSALAGVLQRSGVDIPATPMPAHSMNEKGFFESQAIWKMHESLLSSAGSSWSDWRPLNPGWFTSQRADEFRERALTILDEEFGTSRLFVLKDPRICRLMPFWMSVFAQAGISPVAFHIHRNPSEVAASLNRRDGFEAGYSNLLWMRHVLEAEVGSRGLPRAFISFDQLLEEWPRMLDSAQKSLKLNLPRFSGQVSEEIDAFLSTGLKHHSERIGKVQNNPMLSDWLRDTLTIMERWSQDGEAPADHASLDAIRTRFDAAGPTFGTLLQKGHEAIRRLAKAEEDIPLKDKRLAELETEIERTKRAKAERDARLTVERAEAAAKLAEARKEAEAHLAALTTARDSAAVRIAELEAEAEIAHEEAEGRLAVLEAERAQTTRAKAERDAATAKLAEARKEAEALKAAHQKATAQVAELEAAAEQARRARAEHEARLVAERTEAAAKLSEIHKEAEARLAEIEARTAETDVLQSQVAYLDSALAQRHQEADDWARRSADLEQRLGGIEAERDALRERLEQQVALARDQAAERLVGETEMNKLREAQSRTGAALRQAQERLEQQDEALARNQQEAGDRARRGAELERRLGEIEAEREALRGQFEGQVAQVRDQAAGRLAAEAEIRRLRETQSRTETALLKARERLEQQDSALTKTAQMAGQLQDRLAAEAAMRQAVYESNSWRVTAPLRWFSMRFRRR